MDFCLSGSKVGKFENVKVLNCDESKDACILKRNTTAQIDLDLTLGKYCFEQKKSRF